MDFTIQNHGSVVSFMPLTDAARAWVEENLALESWQWFGASFVVDCRYADGIAQLMTEDGLEIEN